MAAPASAATGGLFTVNTHHLNCGAVSASGGEFSCGEVIVTNTTSASTLTVNVGFLVGGDLVFGLDPSIVNVSLGPGASTSTTVIFNPDDSGHFSTQLRVSATTAGASGSVKVGVGGRGTLP
jgi:hypothetical protein